MPFCVHPENGTKRCRDCDLAYQREYRKHHPDRRKRRLTPDQRLRVNESARRHLLQKKYGLTMEGFEALVAKQQGACASCGRAFGTTPSTRPNVDHDHETGEIRGVLCHGCNAGIGLLGDSMEGVQQALNYLQKVSNTNA